MWSRHLVTTRPNSQGAPPFVIKWTVPTSGDVALYLRASESDCSQEQNGAAVTLNSVSFSEHPFGDWGDEVALSYSVPHFEQAGGGRVKGGRDQEGGWSGVDAGRGRGGSHAGNVAWILSVDQDGFHLGWAGKVQCFMPHRCVCVCTDGMCVCMHAYMHACMHVCLSACLPVCLYVFMYVCMHACMHACNAACMHAYIP
jgi:hypothetical protein